MPSTFYNNTDPFYKVECLRGSDAKGVYIFGGKGLLPEPAVTYIFLELKKKLNGKNRFPNLQRLLNLITLETGIASDCKKIKFEGETFCEVYKEFSSPRYSNPKVSYHGTAPKPGHMYRVSLLAEKMNNLSPENFEKVDNALNTHVWAIELMDLPNPHLKYTLYMSLLLSSIEQLSESPPICKEKPICKECGRELTHSPLEKGRSKMTSDLVDNLLTGKNLKEPKDRIKKLYGEVRSAFLHSGTLSGKEKSGGFLETSENNTEILEDMINVLILNRKLIEQFIDKRLLFR